MGREFIEIIQGCISIKADNLVTPTNDADGNADYLDVNFKGQDVTINLKDYCRQLHSSKIMPDLDLDKVLINKKNMFNEFTKIYSAFVEEVDLLNKTRNINNGGGAVNNQ
jgi:hypothetical protein